jgi:hypothetical protein
MLGLAGVVVDLDGVAGELCDGVATGVKLVEESPRTPERTSIKAAKAAISATMPMRAARGTRREEAAKVFTSSYRQEPGEATASMRHDRQPGRHHRHGAWRRRRAGDERSRSAFLATPMGTRSIVFRDAP